MLRNFTRVAILAAFLASTTVAFALPMPVFEIIGVSPLTNPHPSGDGTMAGSHSWWITTTGAGFLDGELIFKDSFALPTVLGTSVAYDETDIESFVFKHLERALPGVGPISPGISFAADSSQIASASGFVTLEGTAADPVYRLFAPMIQTSVTQSIFAFFPGVGGVYTGEWRMDGITLWLNDAQRTAADPLREIPLLVNSIFPGDWRLTGFLDSGPTTGAVPEPATAVLFAFGLVGLGIVRRRRRR